MIKFCSILAEICTMTKNKKGHSPYFLDFIPFSTITWIDLAYYCTKMDSNGIDFYCLYLDFISIRVILILSWFILTHWSQIHKFITALEQQFASHHNYPQILSEIKLLHADPLSCSGRANWTRPSAGPKLRCTPVVGCSATLQHNYLTTFNEFTCSFLA